MGEVVDTVLDFLRRHRFSKAEAAFRAELLARQGERPCSSSLGILDRDLKLRLCSLQGVDHSLGNEQTSMSALDGDMCNSSVNQGKEAGEILLHRRTEENSCADCESTKLACRELLSPKLECRESPDASGQEFMFENPRNSLDPENAVLSAGSTGKYDLNAALQIEDRVLELDDLATTQGRTNSFRQQEESLPCTLSVGSLEDLVEKGHSKQTVIEYVGNMVAFDTVRDLAGVSNELQKEDGSELHREQDTEDVGFGFQLSKVPCRIGKTEFLKHSTELECASFQSEVEAPIPDVSATKGRMGCLEVTVKETGDRSLQGTTGTEEHLKNGFIANLIPERFFQDPALKTALPLSVVLSSEEKQGLANLECTELKKGEVGKRSGWIQGEAGKPREMSAVFESNSEALVEVIEGQTTADCVENQESISYSGLHCHEELRRLPPVRLHSMDKNVDNCKDGGSAAENSTKSFESAAYKSIESTPEESSAWGAFIDAPLADDMSSSGLKWPVSRPSVSQGIVEDMSARLATAGYGNIASAREFLDEYGDSDTYEDDDDPGYVRQLIEDEAWFFANEIDYPSDEERARRGVDKTNQNGYNGLGKFEKDHRSFVEEESYFSGEEYYRSQAAKTEHYRLRQSEFGSQAAPAESTYNNSNSSDNDKDLLTHPRGVDGNDYNGQFFDAEGLDTMRPEQVWNGFIGENNELEQASTVSGDRLEGVVAEGVDYERYHGSVKSGGVMASSDAADVGSEVRDSLLGGSSQEDIESLRDQELAAYCRSHGSFSDNEEEHEDGKNVPVLNLDEEEEEERDVILRYYNEAWGHTKRTVERDVGNSEIIEQAVLKNEMANITHQGNGRNKVVQGNSVPIFGGFSFPSPSGTGDMLDSRAGSRKSLWSNRESVAQGEETDEFSNSMVGPDNTLAAWKQKSNASSPILCPSEENLPNLILSNHSTDEYVSLDAREVEIEEPDLGEALECGQALTADEEDAADVQALGMDEDQYEIFDLRIIHRRNRTGFEEDKDFPVVINSVIAGRYHVTEYLGSAAFSKAIQAHDLHTGMDVCMKIIKNNKDFFDQSLDEIKLLKFINKHDPADKYHILRLYDYFYHREHLFIVCELLRANLYEFHKFNRESGGEVYFIMPRLQSITRQCLEALEFLHGLGIIHCDLKPENILVKSYSRCEIKIIDLGSSCFQTDHLCSYVQSRSYRAPEVILGLPYDQKIDIWSLGCILAELCSGNVLFQNDSLATLLARVVGILGPIDPELLAKGRDTHKFFTKNHMLYERNQDNNRLEYLFPKKTSLRHRLPMGDKGFVEFVGHLLQNNPASRPSAAEALKHTWLSHPYEPISS